MPYGVWKGIVWIKGPFDLVCVKDLKTLNGPAWSKKRTKRELKLKTQMATFQGCENRGLV